MTAAAVADATNPVKSARRSLNNALLGVEEAALVARPEGISNPASPHTDPMERKRLVKIDDAEAANLMARILFL